jgi:hypothetical protein
MGEAIGNALPFGVGVALSPTAVFLVLLILTSPKGRVNALAFLGGWIVAIAVVGAVALLLASEENASRAGGPADWVSIVKLGLGIALLTLGVTERRGSRRVEADLHRWAETVDTLTPVNSAGVAALFAAIRPKNLILVLGACAAIAQTGTSTATEAVALTVFALIASVGVALPLAVRPLMGDRATTVLRGLRDWTARENSTIISVICLIIGATLIGNGISALTA